MNSTGNSHGISPTDAVRAPGPWIHRDVGASGAAFHVAIAGDEPDRHTVALLHDFPMHWYSWRHQLESLADAGYRVVAIDQRGFGGSDLQPGEVDLVQLSDDVTGVLRAVGTGEFTLVGSGMGGAVAWMTAHRKPPLLKSVVTVCAPHPMTRRAASAPKAIAARRVERELTLSPFKHKRMQDGALVRRILKTWCAPDSATHMAEVSPLYEAPLQRVFASAAALETLDGSKGTPLAARRTFKEPVRVPVWSVIGGMDGRVAVSAYSKDAREAQSAVTHLEIPGTGHFPSEETPDELSEILLQHLEAVGV